MRIAVTSTALVCLINHRTLGQEVASGQEAAKARSSVREIIVSYATADSKLQLYRVRADGSDPHRITDGKDDCMMPAWSPDGKKIAYVRQNENGLQLWICDPDGEQHEALTQSGMHRVPSWLPDSKHIVWMVSKRDSRLKDPAASSQLRIMNTATKESRPLFTRDAEAESNNAMPAVSPDGKKVAFVSDRTGSFRVWLSNLDGSDAKPISPVQAETHETLKLPIEQKVPAWSPDGQWIAHWEGVEMIHMSRFTGIQDPDRDRLIAQTFHVWIVGRDGKGKRKAGPGDDPNWSPDGFVTRSFPDPKKGGANIMIDDSEGWSELPVLPKGAVRYGRFTWKPANAVRSLQGSP